MVDLSFSLYEEIIDWSNESIREETKALSKFECRNVRFNETNILELFRIAQNYKGDGLRYECLMTEDSFFRLTIFLTYHSNPGVEDPTKISRQIIEKCGEYINHLPKITPAEEKQNNEYEQETENQYPAKDMLIKVRYSALGDSFVFKEILQLLDKQGINARMITKQKSEIYHGASNGEEIIVFLINTIVSGVIWDEIKLVIAILEKRFRDNIPLFETKSIDSDYEYLVKSLSIRLNEPLANIVLLNFDAKTKHYTFNLKNQESKRIFVKCNNENEIVKINTSSQEKVSRQFIPK